ncbi:type II secretion system F family protein [Thiolinea disciformis]|uniref:type II secretion system F family protein n=1 Tax=Thiolinea disciformis TaxID=125614 RepID=UPI00036EB72B|nr:type II secretion system F family protein [Thiolinea disciformis]
MPAFEYKAISAAGEAKQGSLEASNEAQVLELLHQQGLMPIRVSAQVQPAAVVATPMARSSWFATKKVNQDEIVAFTQQLSSMLKAGLPLDRSLGIQLEIVSSPALANLIRDLQTRVRSGVHFADALETTGQFNRFYVNMVRAGEASGSIGDALARLVDYLLRAKELRGTVISALIYPTILLVVALSSIFALLFFVVPQFSQMFSDMGAELPTVTKLVVGLGQILQQYWWVVLGVALGLVLLVRFLFTHEQARLWLDRSILHWPLIGALVGKVEMARFSRSLGTLLHNGVPLLGSLHIVKNTMGNRIMARSVAEAAESLKQGETLTRTLLSKKVFPAYALHMMRVGEETGRMEELLNDIAVIYDDEVKTSIKRLLALLEPLLILVMAMAILVIVFAILLPMINMTNLVH